MNKVVIKNFFFAFGAQVVSLSASLLITFFAPALIEREEFAYWQLFLTYVTYVNITRLGISDGLYLRLGGKRYEELDFELLSHERQIYVCYQAIIALIFAGLIYFSSISPDRKFVLLACAACIVIVNANGYLIYILQAVNLTSIYSTSVVLQNMTWFIAVGIICFGRILSYKVIVIMYVCGHLCSSVYLMYHAKEIVKHKYIKLGRVLTDIKENIKCGIKLMIATYAGSLIISSVRMIVDASWGVEVFGVFSFSLTLSNVFLTFISQVSIVVFPALRRVPVNRQKKVYIMMRNALSLILPLVMAGYLPIVLIVHQFLPQYIDSLAFLPMFLPICTFDGKMQMLCSSFFKSLRKENTLLKTNLFTLLLSMVVALTGCFIVKNINFVAVGILVVVAFRSIISELILAKEMKCTIYKDLTMEILMVVLFIVGATRLRPMTMFVVYAIIYVMYLLINMKKVNELVHLRN